MTYAIVALLGALFHRLRGGLFDDITGALQQTQAQRLIWAFPTAALTAIAAHATWLTFGELVLMAFASFALLGHGGHMVFDVRVIPGKQTEITTAFWLPALFGGLPDVTWRTWRVYLFHAIGMSFIGLLRNSIAMIPLFFVGGSTLAGIYIASGLLHGPLYWLAHRITPWGSKGGEAFVGAWCWLVIYQTGVVL